MPSRSFDGIHGRATLGVACHPFSKKAHTIGKHRAWMAIITLGQHIRSDDVGSGMLALHTHYTHSRTTSRMACHNHFFTAHTNGKNWAWHAISPLENTKVEGRQAFHARVDFGQHTRSDDGGHDMPSKSLDNTNSLTTSGMACYHNPCRGNTVRQRLL